MYFRFHNMDSASRDKWGQACILENPGVYFGRWPGAFRMPRQEPLGGDLRPFLSSFFPEAPQIYDEREPAATTGGGK